MTGATRVTPEPVMLYNGPHPVHRKMAEAVGAELVECDHGGALDRLRTGAGRDFGDRPILVEGGTPLLETAFAVTLGDTGPVVELAADATHHDIVNPLPFRGRAGRLAHRVGERFVDATIAVSDVLAGFASRYDRPVRVVHPFVEAERHDELTGMDVDVSGSDVLCVGKYRPKNGQDVLLEAADRMTANATVHFVGPDTEDLPERANTESHGFVDEETFADLFDRACLLAFPAPVGAFPVVVLEAMCAGLPVVTSPGVGNAGLIRAIDDRYVVDPTPESVAAAVDWYLDRPPERRADHARLARSIGARFDEQRGVAAFVSQFLKILDDVGNNVEVTG